MINLYSEKVTLDGIRDDVFYSAYLFLFSIYLLFRIEPFRNDCAVKVIFCNQHNRCHYGWYINKTVIDHFIGV